MYIHFESDRARGGKSKREQVADVGTPSITPRSTRAYYAYIQGAGGSLLLLLYVRSTPAKYHRPGRIHVWSPTLLLIAKVPTKKAKHIITNPSTKNGLIYTAGTIPENVPSFRFPGVNWRSLLSTANPFHVVSAPAELLPDFSPLPSPPRYFPVHNNVSFEEGRGTNRPIKTERKIAPHQPLLKQRIRQR